MSYDRARALDPIIPTCLDVHLKLLQVFVVLQVLIGSFLYDPGPLLPILLNPTCIFLLSCFNNFLQKKLAMTHAKRHCELTFFLGFNPLL